MKKTALYKALGIMTAVVTAASACNFTAFAQISGKERVITETEAITGIDISDYNTGTVLNNDDLTDLGLTLASDSDSAFVPDVKIGETKDHVDGGSDNINSLVLTIKKGMKFTLKKNFTIPEKNGGKPTKVKVSYWYKIEYNDDKRPNFDNFGKLSKTGGTDFINPILNKDNWNKLDSADTQVGYFAFGQWNKMEYEIDYTANKAKISKSLTWGNIDTFEKDITTADLPDCLTWKQTDALSGWTDSDEAYLYLDDMEIQYDYSFTETAVNIIGTAAANSNVKVWIVEQNKFSTNAAELDENSAAKAETAANGNGVYSQELWIRDKDKDYAAAVKIGDKILCRDLSCGRNIDGELVLEMDMFNKNISHNCCFTDIKIVGSSDAMYKDYTLNNGETVFTGKIGSKNITGSNTLVCAVYDQHGAMYDSDIQEITLAAGTEVDYSVTVETKPGYTAKLMIIDNIDSMNILSDVYTIGNGVVENVYSEKAEFVVDEEKFRFDPLNVSFEVFGDVQMNGYAAAVAVPKGADITSENIKFLSVSPISVSPISDSSQKLAEIKITDKKANESEYDVYLIDKQTKHGPYTFKFISSESFSEIYGILNDENVTADDVSAVINNSILNLDLSDYSNLLSNDEKRLVLNKFIEYKTDEITSIRQIQNLLDRAVGILLLTQKNNKPAPESIIKYVSVIGVDTELFNVNDLKTGAVDEIAEQLFNKATEENLREQFEDIYISAYIKTLDDNGIKNCITDKFARYIDVNIDMIAKNGADEKAVYSYIRNNTKSVTSVEDIRTLFYKAVDYAKKNTDDFGVTINSVEFLDAGGMSYKDLEGYADSISCKVKYTNSSDEANEIYAILVYYKNDKLLSARADKFMAHTGNGEFTTDLLDISERNGKGIYRVSAYFYKDMTAMSKYSDDEYSVSRIIYDNILKINGCDYGGFENDIAAFWMRCNMWINYEHENAPSPQIGAENNLTGENSNVRSGNYSTRFLLQSLQDGLRMGDNIVGETVTNNDFKPDFVKDDPGFLGIVKQKGSGEYRLTAYVKPELTDCSVKIAVNDINNRTFGAKFSKTDTAKAGKWNKISMDFVLSDTELAGMTGFSVSVTAEKCLDEFGNEIACKEQNIYVDDISLTKTSENMETDDADLIITGAAEENACADVMITDKNAYMNGNVGSEAIAFIKRVKSDSKGRFECEVSFDGNISDYIAVVKTGNKVYQRELTASVEKDGKRHLEIGYFVNEALKGAYIEDVKLSGFNGLYSEMALPPGNVTVRCPVYSIDSSDNAVLVVSLFRKGRAVRVYFDEKSLTKGSTVNFETTFSVNEGDTAKIFLIDNMTERNILGNAYEICTDGLTEYKTADSNVNISVTDSYFNPVYLSNDVIAVSGSGYVTVFAVTAGSTVSAENIMYADFVKVTENTNNVIRVAMPESTADNSSFDIYEGNCDWTDKQTFVYHTAENYQSYFDSLNSSAVNTDTVNTVVKTPELKLNMDKTAELSSAQYERFLRLFVEFKPAEISSVLQIQQTIDSAANLILLSVKPSIGIICECGKEFGLNTQMIDSIIDKTATDAVKADIVNNMLKNPVAVESINTETVRKQFISAYVAADVKNNTHKYQDLQKFVAQTYKEYIKLDESLAAAKGMTMSDAFKAMYASVNSIDSINDITDIYNKAVSDYKRPTSPSGGSSGGGGYRQSGGNTVVQMVNEPAESENIFVDVNADFWAAESIIKLKNKGIISPDTYFRPNDNVTREEFTKMVVIAFDLKENGTTKGFSDTHDDAWYFPYVIAAADNDIIYGKDDNSFGVGEAITRQDMAVIIARLLNDKLDTSAELKFTDSTEISDYAKDAVGGLTSVKIINGYEDNSFRPKNLLTRAESTAVLAAVMKLIEQ